MLHCTCITTVKYAHASWLGIAAQARVYVPYCMFSRVDVVWPALPGAMPDAGLVFVMACHLEHFPAYATLKSLIPALLLQCPNAKDRQVIACPA